MVAIATVLPLFAVEHLPFTDLPEHLAVMASLRHWFDPAWRIREHYSIALWQSQYLLYHGLGALGSVVTGSAESANRVLLAVVGVAFPFSLRSLLRATNRDERLALFACPLFWNRALVVGFLPYVASLPLLVYTLALVVRVLKRMIEVSAWILMPSEEYPRGEGQCRGLNIVAGGAQANASCSNFAPEH